MTLGIKTGLPYKIEEMDKINEVGAHIDMSNIDFPGVSDDEIYKITFIYLRNTGFTNIYLDFSKCDYERKSKFLKTYLENEIELDQFELINSYIVILNRMQNNDITDIDCILNSEEINKFIDEYKDTLNDILNLIMSLPIFALFYFSLNNKAYTLDDIEKETFNEKLNINNIYYLIEKPEIMTLYLEKNMISPKFYENLFKIENIRLFKIVEKLPFFPILNILSTVKSDIWDDLENDFDYMEKNRNE